MGPRADFECRKCEATYDDLPVESTRCPVCGFRRGFRRLFNRINVSTTGHRVAQVLDPMMRPQLEKLDQVRAEQAASEARIREDSERMIETTPEPERPAARQMQQAHGGPVRWLGKNEAKAAHAGIDPGGRAASRAILPHLKRRIVKLPA